jgi:hypothetical protein
LKKKVVTISEVQVFLKAEVNKGNRAKAVEILSVGYKRILMKEGR